MENNEIFYDSLEEDNVSDEELVPFYNGERHVEKIDQNRRKSTKKTDQNKELDVLGRLRQKSYVEIYRSRIQQAQHDKSKRNKMLKSSGTRPIGSDFWTEIAERRTENQSDCESVFTTFQDNDLKKEYTTPTELSQKYTPIVGNSEKIPKKNCSKAELLERRVRYGNRVSALNRIRIEVSAKPK